MKLTSIKRGRAEDPLRIYLYGSVGSGKSSTGAQIPGAVSIGPEDGIARTGMDRIEPTSWQDVLDFVATLANEKHDYKALVIDTLDWIEPLCWEYTCKKHGEPNIDGLKGRGSQFSYGNGYKAALSEWRILISKLETLRKQRGMAVVPLGHAIVKQFKNPEGEDYDQYIPKLQAAAAALWSEWVDALIFLKRDIAVVSSDDRSKALGTGKRLACVEGGAAYVAKNRFHLTEPIELPPGGNWKAIMDAIASDDPKARAAILEEIITWIPRLPEAKRADAEAFVARTRLGGSYTMRTLQSALATTIEYANANKENA